MRLLNLAKEITTGLVQGWIQARDKAWWVKVTTAEPYCIYYFGPFQSLGEAESNRSGYVTDLADEGAKGIVATVERCNPKALTVCNGDNY